MNGVLDVLLAAAMGVGSALLPILNAEAYALVAVAARPRFVVPVVAALAVGQTVGKLVLFEAGRRGSTYVRERRSTKPRRARRTDRWSARVNAALARPRTAVPVVLAAASVGLPPLAIVSVAAGAAGQQRSIFGATCLVGRLVRFGVIAVPVVLASRG